MNTIYGLPVIITPDRPRMQLSARVCEVLTPAMVEDHNTWLLKFFGMTNILKDGDIIQASHDHLMPGAGPALYMNPNTYEQLRAMLIEQGRNSASNATNYRW